MKDKLHPHRTGLALGVIFGLAHLFWSLLVMLGIAKPLVDWLMSLHFINVSYTLSAFEPVTAFILVCVAALWGYVIGYVFAIIWRWVATK